MGQAFNQWFVEPRARRDDDQKGTRGTGEQLHEPVGDLARIEGVWQEHDAFVRGPRPRLRELARRPRFDSGSDKIVSEADQGVVVIPDDQRARARR